MSEAIEIPYAVFAAMADDLVAGPSGHGTDPSGRRFTISRFTSRSTGKRYDSVFTPGVDTVPRVIEMPKA